MLPPTAVDKALRSAPHCNDAYADRRRELKGDKLGHASSVLTLDTYSHITPTMQEGGADRMERFIFGLRKSLVFSVLLHYCCNK